MQRVTAAHAANDLHTLLTLEVEFLHAEAADVTRLAAGTVEAYSQMLKEQAAALREELFALRFHPKYEVILDEDRFGSPSVIDGPSEVARLDVELLQLRAEVARLAGPAAIDHARSIVQAVRDARRQDTRHRKRRRRRQ